MDDSRHIRFSKWYEMWAEPIYRFLYVRCGDKAAAEDFTQDAFVKLWHKMDEIDDAKVKSYLFSIARNTMINEFHHQKVVDKFKVRLKPESGIPSPQFEMEMNEFGHKLQAVLNAMPANQREVFMLNRMEGYKYREIADLLELSQKAIEKRMSAALIFLRENLGDVKI